MAQVDHRKPKPLMNPTQLQTSARAVDAFVPVADETLPQSESLQALNTLNEIIPGAADGIAGEFNKAIKADEVRQASLAWNNKIPSEDATVAGAAAHKSVKMRNLANAKIKQLKADGINWQGTDPEWDAHKVQFQSDMLDELGGDIAAQDVLASVYQEQLPAVDEIRFKAKQNDDQIEKFDTSVVSLHDAVDDSKFTDVEKKANLAQVVDEMDKYGASGETQRKAVVETAIAMLQADSPFLAEVLMDVGMFEKEPGVQTAYAKYQQRLDDRLIGESAVRRTALVDSIGPTGMTRTEFFAKGQASVDANGKQDWKSAEQLEAAWKKSQKVADTKFNAQRYLDISNQPGIPAEYSDPDFLTKAEKREVKDLKYSLYNAEVMKIKENVPEGQDRIEAITEATGKYGQWLTRQGWKSEQIQRSADNIINLTMDFADGLEDNPEALVSIDRAVGQFDFMENSPAARVAHYGVEGSAVIDQYKKNLARNYTPAQSMRGALRMRDAAKLKTSTHSQAVEVRKNVAAEVEDVFENSFWSFSDGASVGQMEKITNEILPDVLTKMKLGMDEDLAVSSTLKEYEGNHIKLSDGTVIKGSVQQINGAMNDKAGWAVNEAALMGLAKRMDNLSDRPGFEDFVVQTAYPDPNSWNMVVQDKMVYFTDPEGFRVTKSLALHEVSGFTADQKLEERRNREETLRVLRKSLKYDPRFPSRADQF